MTIGTATINGISMRYADEGKANGPAVVLHHPLATDLTFWDEATAALAPDYRVVRFDARGHGKSTATPAPYAFETLTADVVALMDHLKIGTAQFVGLSMGGMVAQYLGLLHPARFKSLSIVASSSRIPPEMRHLWQDRVKVARADGMASQVDPALGRWVTAANRSSRPELVQRFAGMIRATPVEGYAGWCGAIETLDMSERDKAIRLPTLVVAGAEDPGTPPAAMEIIHKAVPGSRYHVVPHVAHMLACEDPAAFHALLLPFLKAHA